MTVAQFSNNRKEKVYDLEERTAVFSEGLIVLCKSVAKNVVTTPIISQLIRAGTSIGANYCEANGASSRKDFRNKIYICKKEARETKYWLRLLAKALGETTEENDVLTREVQELILIFSKIAAKSD